MKQGWEIKKLGEVCEIVGGSTPKTNESSYWDGEHYWVTPAVLNGAKYISSTSRTITDAGVKSAHLQLLPIGTVLLSSRAPIGKVAITTVPMYCNQGFKNLICSDKLYNEFAYWFLYHNTEYLNSLGTGATFKEISKRVVEQISIPIPPYAEQERIVGILDKEFERIDALKANAEQNLQHAKDLFQSALKQELQPKEGWTVKHLEKISTFSQGVQVEIGKQSTEMQDGYMRFLRIVDFTKGNEPPRYVGITDEKYQVKYDSLSVVRYGASAGFICTGLEGVIANNIFRIVPKKDILIGNTYLYYVLISDIFQSVIRDSVNGAAMPAISFGMIKNIDIPYPSIDEQQSIVVRLDKLREHCKALEENYTKTIALCDDMKQALLRKAFNGEL